MLFKNFTSKFIEEYAIPSLKRKTISGYLTMLKRINYAIGDIPLNKFTPEIISKFINNLKKPGVKIQKANKSTPASLSEKTIKNYYALLCSIFRVAFDWEYIKQNPMLKVKSPKVRRKKVKSLTTQQVKILLEALSNAPLKYQVFIQIAIYSGMRNGEIAALTWDDISFENCLIYINNELLYTPQDGVYLDVTKTEESERVIKIDKSFFSLLKKYKDEQDAIKKSIGDNWNKSGNLFVQANGTPMHPTTAYNWFVRWQEKNQLVHCSIHQLRHTNATLLFLNGINEKIVSGRLGHSNTGTTTNIYASYIKEADALASQTITDILSKPNARTKRKFRLKSNKRNSGE